MRLLIYDLTNEEIEYLDERIQEIRHKREEERHQLMKEDEQRREAEKFCAKGHYQSSKERHKGKCSKCEYLKPLPPKPMIGVRKS